MNKDKFKMYIADDKGYDLFVYHNKELTPKQRKQAFKNALDNGMGYILIYEDRYLLSHEELQGAFENAVDLRFGHQLFCYHLDNLSSNQQNLLKQIYGGK